MGEWTLFSNHGHVLVCLAKNNEARLRDVAAEVGITERAVQNILRELQQSGLVAVSKHGRCNHYQINSRKHLRHPLESHCTVGKLLQLLIQEAADKAVQPPEPVTVTKQAKPEPSVPPPVPVEIEQQKEPVQTRPTPSGTSVSRAAETDKKTTPATPAANVPEPEQEKKDSPAPVKVASKPEPARSKKEAVKKDSKKTDDNSSSQQGSLF